MKESYWGWWLIALGIFVVVILLLVQNVTSNNTEDFYSINQVSESAMLAAVDYAYYRDYGELKINKEKFMEVFLRQFAETVNGRNEYTITFTSIYEAPPKASVEVSSKTNTYVVANDAETLDLTSRVDAILEQN
jgi:hypothetical protein